MTTPNNSLIYLIIQGKKLSYEILRGIKITLDLQDIIELEDDTYLMIKKIDSKTSRDNATIDTIQKLYDLLVNKVFKVFIVDNIDSTNIIPENKNIASLDELYNILDFKYAAKVIGRGSSVYLSISYIPIDSDSQTTHLFPTSVVSKELFERSHLFNNYNIKGHKLVDDIKDNQGHDICLICDNGKKIEELKTKIELYENEITFLKSMLSQTKSDEHISPTALKEEFHSLRTQYQDIQSELSQTNKNLLQQQASHKLEVASLQKIINNQKQEIEHLNQLSFNSNKGNIDSSLEYLNKVIDDQKQTIASLNGTMQSLNNNLSEAQQINNALKLELKNAQNELNKIQNKSTAQQADQQDYLDAIEQYKAQVNEYKQNIEAYKKQIEVQKHDIYVLESRLENKVNDIMKNNSSFNTTQSSQINQTKDRSEIIYEPTAAENYEDLEIKTIGLFLLSIMTAFYAKIHLFSQFLFKTITI